jgi:coenzyme F420-reducing hydrogenase alpha subunit
LEKVKDPEVAKRIARAVVSDIAMYNQKKVEEGIRSDNLFQILKDEIEEGKQYYEHRVARDIVENYSFFEAALVDILVKQAPRIPSKIW